MLLITPGASLVALFQLFEVTLVLVQTTLPVEVVAPLYTFRMMNGRKQMNVK